MIGLICPGNIWFAPYMRPYMSVLDGLHAEYEIVSWNMDGKDGETGVQYKQPFDNTVKAYAKVFAYIKYFNFIKDTVKEKQYTSLIVFGPKIPMFILHFLKKHYKGKFINDYRDLSIEQKPFFKGLFKSVCQISYANVISSPGFESCLPECGHYYLSHNFDAGVVRSVIDKPCVETSFSNKGKIDVLTIGGIRDYSSNIEVLKALADNHQFSLRFVGKGCAAASLEDYCKANGVKNVSFTGYYQKPEEAGYIQSSTFMNIFYPRIITHDTALSNRFYNSLIYKKPMIVTKHTTQGDYADKYGVGVAVEDCGNLADELREFLQGDFTDYSERCNSLLRSFLKDQEEFEAMVSDFVSKFEG